MQAHSIFGVQFDVFVLEADLLRLALSSRDGRFGRYSIPGLAEVHIQHQRQVSAGNVSSAVARPDMLANQTTPRFSRRHSGATATDGRS